MTEKTQDKLWKQIQRLNKQKQVICSYYVGIKINTVCIDVDKDESIFIYFEKGCAIVRTQNEVKFACKIKDFISLWK